MATKQTSKAGLGSKVFFQQMNEAGADEQEKTPTKSIPKYKASLELAGETYKALSALKLHFREQRGKYVSFAQIIDQAVQELLEKEEIEA